MQPENNMNNVKRPGPLTLDAARSRLARIWFSGAGFVFFVLMVQSLFGKYGGDTQQVWAWFVPCVVPTLPLMISVLGAGALGSSERHYLRRNFFELTQGISVTYLIVLFLTVVAASINVPAVDTLAMSNVWLGPLQGIVVAAIGYIFISKHALDTDKSS